MSETSHVHIIDTHVRLTDVALSDIIIKNNNRNNNNNSNAHNDIYSASGYGAKLYAKDSLSVLRAKVGQRLHMLETEPVAL